VRLGEHADMSLFRRDAILLARYPRRDDMLGKTFASATSFREILSRANVGSAVVTSPRISDPSNQEIRVVAARALNSVPLVVASTLSEREFLPQWRTTALFVMTGTVISAVLMGLMMLGIVRKIAETERLGASLGKAQNQLSDALNAMPHGFLVYDVNDGFVAWNRAYADFVAIPSVLREGLPFE